MRCNMLGGYGAVRVGEFIWIVLSIWVDMCDGLPHYQ